MAGRIDGLPLYILCPALPLPCWTTCAVTDLLLKFIRLSDGAWAITRRETHSVTRHPGLVVLQEDKAVNGVHEQELRVPCTAKMRITGIVASNPN